MSFRDRGSNHRPAGQQGRRAPLDVSGLVTQLSPLEQIPFPGEASAFTGGLPGPLPFSDMSGEAPVPTVVTGTLAELPAVSGQTGQQQPVRNTSALLRDVVVVHATHRRAHHQAMVPSVPGKRHLMMHLGVLVLSLLIVGSALSVVLPVNSDGRTSIFSPVFSLVKSRGNNTALIADQIATATAVTQDGYDPGGGHTYVDVLSQPASSASTSFASDQGSLNRFFYGQCTYWANMHYHALTGHWVPWLGNAYQWAYQAPAYGWVVSNTPNPDGPAIMVLQPYVEQASAYGHVAVVEHINPDGSVLTSNWNWDGGWARESYVTFTPGPGVKFLWYPS